MDPLERVRVGVKMHHSICLLECERDVYGHLRIRYRFQPGVREAFNRSRVLDQRFDGFVDQSGFWREKSRARDANAPF